MECRTLSPMKRIVLLFMLMLLLGSTVPHGGVIELDSDVFYDVQGRATGVDLTVTDTSFSYTTGSDEEQFRMFSSNYPVLGFNRPQSLYVVDAVVDVPIQLEALIENQGTAQSGSIDVNIKVLHNEYTLFEIINETVQLTSLDGGNSNSIQKTFTPTYAGNHTLIVRATSSILDDNMQNNAATSTITVASSYFNCDSLTNWTVGTEWGINTDTSLSKGSSCHVGKGQTSSYSNNLATSLVTPVMDMSDAVESPSRTNGLTFYYTGSADTNDNLKVQVKTVAGGWANVANVQGTVDQDFTTGQDYRTFSVNNGGLASPLIPVPQEHFHSQTQFRFLFESDAVGVDIGYYFDELVFVYDQKVREEEFSLTANGVSTSGSTPGQWGSVRVEVTNDGNISDSLLPSVDGLLEGWEVYFANTNGVSINAQTGVLLAPGESKLIDVKIKPDANATNGFQQLIFIGTSSQYSYVNTTLAMQFQVVPDREPFIVRPESAPRCPPGSSCGFTVEIQNLGGAVDVFELSINDIDLPEGWSVHYGWTQVQDVLVRPNTPVLVEFTLTVPGNAIPDSMNSFTLTAVSQNNSIRSYTQTIDVAASMVSNASVGMTDAQMNRDWNLLPGATRSVEFTVWNNASRQDIFIIDLDFEEDPNWLIDAPPQVPAVINSQSSTTFRIDITAPLSAFAGEKPPEITPQITSQRSSMVFVGETFDSITVETVVDLSLNVDEIPAKLIPGMATKLSVTIENRGNGPVEAMLYPLNFPETWQWWIVSPGGNATGLFALAAEGESEDSVPVDIMILIPSVERAGKIHSLTFAVDNQAGAVDENPSDNSIDFDTVTAAVRTPKMLPNIDETTASVGGISSVNLTVQNIGNALDDAFEVQVSVSASPPNPDLVSFFGIEGSSSALQLGQYATFAMDAGEKMVLAVDMLIPETMQLNSRIVVTFDVAAGSDDEGRPIRLTHEILVVVDTQRVLNAELSQPIEQSVDTGVPVEFWVNLSSASTQAETHHLEIQKPEGWQVVCQGLLMNETAREIEFAPGDVTLQYNDIKCELHRMSGDLNGGVEVTIESVDGALKWNGENYYSFNERAEEGVLFSTNFIAASIAGLLFAVLITVLVVRRRSKALDLPDEKQLGKHWQSDSVAAELNPGPPISTQPEPPSQVLQHKGPPLPETGLPPGWTDEQWHYYGQQYLDAKQ